MPEPAAGRKAKKAGKKQGGKKQGAGKRGGKKQGGKKAGKHAKERRVEVAAPVVPAPPVVPVAPAPVEVPAAAEAAAPPSCRVPAPVATEAETPTATLMAAPGVPPAEAPARDPNRIGIVFVHGIGSQRPGETLLAWSRPLLRLLSAWRATTTGVKPLNDPTADANVDFSGGSRPFVTASVPAIAGHPAQTWVMTEAWWAASVRPPSVGEVFRWLVPREMFRLWSGIVSGLASEGGIFYRLVDLVFLPLFLLPATLAIVLVYLLFRFLRLIPVRALQESVAVASIGLFLVDWFGDVRILLTDRGQAASIRARVADAIADCVDAGCGTIVLVGHSGGTIVGYMTLADETWASLPVNVFITHGQALGLAWRLGHADEYSVPDRSPDRLYRGDRLRTNLSMLPYRADLRWHDFWATHDPAPAGGFRNGPWVTKPELVNGRSTRIFNRMSLRNDHGRYWDNDEQFVLPVARLIDTAPGAEANGAARRSRFFPESEATRRAARRRWRVKLLQFAWVAVMGSAVAAIPTAILGPLVTAGRGSLETAGVAAWDALITAVDALDPTWRWLNLRPVVPPIGVASATIIGIVALATAYWVTGRVMSGLWTRWDARERQIALQPIPGWRSPWPLALQLALCGGAALWLLAFAASGEWRYLLPSIGLVAAAWLLGLVTGRGRIRRPTQQELELEGVAP